MADVTRTANAIFERSFLPQRLKVDNNSSGEFEPCMLGILPEFIDSNQMPFGPSLWAMKRGIKIDAALAPAVAPKRQPCNPSTRVPAAQPAERQEYRKQVRLVGGSSFTCSYPPRTE